MLDGSPDRRKLVLLVDDDPSLLQLGRLNLEHAGYTCIGACGGREGLRQARRALPDLILLDYMMPDLSGKEVFLELCASDDPRLRRTPVIMLTARTNNHTEQRELLKMGLAAYLHKPFGYHELLNIIDNVLVMSQIKERNRVLEADARRSFISTVRTLINLLFVKDSYTGEHSNRAAELAEGVALQYGLSEEETMYVKLGALLHDIGKIGVAESVLCKPSRLTAQETDAMRCHVTYGEQALGGVPHMEAVQAMVKYHHEWWNGDGYLAGLSGEEIPLGARIIAVVDAYDAMTTDRPYRFHLSQETAIGRLRAAAGTQFDPLIVEKLCEFLGTYDAGPEHVPDLGFLEELCLVV